MLHTKKKTITIEKESNPFQRNKREPFRIRYPSKVVEADHFKKKTNRKKNWELQTSSCFLEIPCLWPFTSKRGIHDK